MKGKYSFIVVFMAICVAIVMVMYGLVNDGTIGRCVASVGVMVFIYVVNAVCQSAKT